MAEKYRSKPNNGEIWKHFKGNLYRIWFYPVINATNNGDTKEYVCYQPWSDPKKPGFYIREIGEFMSEVDRVKYPNAKQTYRFEKVEQNP